MGEIETSDNADNRVRDESRIGRGKPGPGRPKGTSNRITNDVRAMVLEALDRAGGADYLLEQSREQPQAFMALLGKCLPRELNVAHTVTLESLLDEVHARRVARLRGDQVPAPAVIDVPAEVRELPEEAPESAESEGAGEAGA